MFTDVEAHMETRRTVSVAREPGSELGELRGPSGGDGGRAETWVGSEGPGKEHLPKPSVTGRLAMDVAGAAGAAMAPASCMRDTPLWRAAPAASSEKCPRGRQVSLGPGDRRGGRRVPADLEAGAVAGPVDDAHDVEQASTEHEIDVEQVIALSARRGGEGVWLFAGGWWDCGRISTARQCRCDEWTEEDAEERSGVHVEDGGSRCLGVGGRGAAPGRLPAGLRRTRKATRASSSPDLRWTFALGPSPADAGWA